MHAKTDSEVTSLAASSPPRSPRTPCRPVYYVMSPSQADAERASMGTASTPGASPLHHHHSNNHSQQHQIHYLCSSPIHHSRESSTARFSALLRNGGASWLKLHQYHAHDGDEDDDEEEGKDEQGTPVRYLVAMFVLGFAILFTLFSLILWGASKPYKPEIFIKSVVFESYNVQAGMDLTGVPTKMLSINSTVKLSFRNPATFFGVHVSSTPWRLFYFDLNIATGHMLEFYQSRKSRRIVKTNVKGVMVPLYGGGAVLDSRSAGGPPAVVPLSLTFVVRARAHVLGLLVKSKFYRRIHCNLLLHENRLGKPIYPKSSCEYNE